MESNELLLRLVYRAFVEIRAASASSDTRTIGRVADLLHNVPLAMIGTDGNNVFKQLVERAGVTGMSSWLQTALEDIKANSIRD